MYFKPTACLEATAERVVPETPTDERCVLSFSPRIDSSPDSRLHATSYIVLHQSLRSWVSGTHMRRQLLMLLSITTLVRSIHLGARVAGRSQPCTDFFHKKTPVRFRATIMSYITSSGALTYSRQQRDRKHEASGTQSVAHTRLMS